MSTGEHSEVTKAELFYHYLGKRLARGERDHPVAELVSEFEEYCQELDSLRSLILEAEVSSARGESTSLDLEEVLRRGRERAAERGITD